MKTQNYIIQIPEPCHEDWNKMAPDATGKFCGSCCKSVVDFSNKTDEEIRTILLEKKNEKVCGHFRKTQVDRPLNIRLDLNNLPKNMSSTKRFAIAAFIVFGSFLFSCTDLKGQKIKNIEIENTEEIVYMKGKIKGPGPGKRVEPVQEVDSVISASECFVDGDVSFKIGEVFEMAVVDTPVVELNPEIFVAGGISFTEVKDTTPVPVPDTVSIPMINPFLDSLISHDLFTMGAILQVSTLSEDVLNEMNADSAQNKSEYPGNVLNEQPELSIYPNPSNGEFNIRYDVLKRSDVRLDIFDEKGILIWTVADVKSQYEGKYTLPTNLPDLPNGIYTVSLVIDRKRITEKLVIAK